MLKFKWIPVNLLVYLLQMTCSFFNKLQKWRLQSINFTLWCLHGEYLSGMVLCCLRCLPLSWQLAISENKSTLLMLYWWTKPRTKKILNQLTTCDKPVSISPTQGTASSINSQIFWYNLNEELPIQYLTINETCHTALNKIIHIYPSFVFVKLHK